MGVPQCITNKLLPKALVCSIALVLTLSCEAKDDSPTIYKREYDVDFEHGFQEGLGEVEVNGKWGFINSSGQIVIKPRFNQVLYPFKEGIAIVRAGAIIDTAKAWSFGGRLAGQVKFIDKEGRTIWKYSGQPFSEGLAVTCVVPLWAQWGMLSIMLGQDDPKWGFINAKGEMVVPAKYDEVDSFSEGLAAFRDPNMKWGYINHMGETVIEPRYRWAGIFSEGLAAVGKKEGRGFINKQGDMVIPLKYESTRNFREGLAAVSIKDKDNEKWGFIDKSGNVIIPLQYDYAVGFREQLATVEKNDKWGYITASGDLVIPFRFDDAEAFSEGLAQVKIGDKWGYINKKGDFVIEPKFYLASPFTEGFAKVAVGDKLGYIDKQGKYIWEPTR